MRSRGLPISGLAVFCLVSCLLHAGICMALLGYGRIDLAPPVPLSPTIAVDLTSVSSPRPANLQRQRRWPPATSSPAPRGKEGAAPITPPADKRISPPEAEKGMVPPEGAKEAVISPPKREDTVKVAAVETVTVSTKAGLKLPAPIRTPAEFVTVRREKLSYLVTLHGLPVGTAQMEATNHDNELRITTTARSNGLLALVYPVDNTTETRMFNGRYIMTVIRQREGEFRKDFGFTLNLGERNVFWSDRLRQLHGTEPLPSDRVVDLMTGFYSLRIRPLAVGESVIIPLYDSNAYAPTEVEVLRREQLSLSAGRVVDTLVLRPRLTTDGFVRRAGEMVIWLTDDDNRVPVRMETTVAPLGTIVVELVSAETDR